jgi:hypothetical protein
MIAEQRRSLGISSLQDGGIVRMLLIYDPKGIHRIVSLHHPSEYAALGPIIRAHQHGASLTPLDGRLHPAKDVAPGVE